MSSKPAAALGRDAFTILELMIVVSIIGLLAVLAVPAAMKQRMHTRNTAFLNDLRVLSASFEQYAIECGDYPPDAGPGIVPAGFSPYLPARFDWDEDTNIGGSWDWDRASDPGDTVFGVYAGLSVVGPKRTALQMADIDAKIDDGNIDSGRFLRRDGGYIYVFRN